MALSRAAFEYVRDLLAKEAGGVLGEDRISYVEAQLTPLAQSHRAGSTNELVRRLMAEPANELHREAIDALVSTDTGFFRDMRVFEYLRSEFLPELERKRGGEKRVRIWSAACSTGQEAFSVALLIREHFPQWADWEVEILASDICHRAVTRAQQGRFDQLEINRGLPARLLVKYFHQEGLLWYLVDDIYSRVQFQELSLTGEWPALGEMDLILLRNVLSDMSSEARKGILTKMARHLKRDGCLVLGANETVSELAEWFRAEESGKVVTYRLAW